MALIPEVPLIHVVNQLRHLVATRGRAGDLADLQGLRILGRASSVVPTVVDSGDDVLFYATPEGALVVAAVRDDGTTTYMRLDNSNNLHVIDANGGLIVSALNSLLLELGNVEEWVQRLQPGLVQVSDKTEALTLPLEALKSDTGIIRLLLSKLYVIYNAYDTMAIANRVLGVNQPQDHINGPARLALLAAVPVAGSPYTYDTYVAPYTLITIGAKWTNDNVAETGQLDFFARIDDNAAGLWVNVNTAFTPAGTGLGVAAQNGQGLYVTTRAVRFREFRVTYTKNLDAGGADTLEIWQTLGSNC